MDFHGLSRRELQALCKRFQLPANMTNVAMADSLNALQSVEGVDEVLQACESETAQLSLSTGGRSTSRRNRSKKMDSVLKECAEEGRKDVLLTPAPLGATSRRKAMKEDSAVKQVYSVRRSARLAAKSGNLLKGDGNDNTGLSRKDLFADHGQEFEMNLKESLDGSDEMSGVTVMEENFERKDEELVDSVSTNAESLPKIEEDMHIHVETVGLTENSLKLLKEVHNKNLDFPKKDLSIDDGLALLKESQEGVDVILGVTVMEKNFERKDEELVDSVSANAEPLPRIEEMIIHFETEGLTENHLKLSKEVDNKKFDFPKKDLSNDDCLVFLKESPGDLDVISEVASVDEEKKGEAHVDSSEKQDSPIDSSNANVPKAELNKSCSEFGGSGDENVTENEADSSETESIPNESDSATCSLTEGSANCSDSLDCTPSEISLMSYEDNAFDWGSTQDVDDTKATEQVLAIEKETVTAIKPTTDVTTIDEVSPNPSLHLTSAKLSDAAGDSNATFLPFFIGSDPSYTVKPTLSTPKIASASKAYSRMLGITAASDNKENIGSGSKTAPARERSKMVKDISEAVPKLDDRALVQLSKEMKRLQVNLKFDNEVRTALQPLSENHRDV